MNRVRVTRQLAALVVIVGALAAPAAATAKLLVSTYNEGLEPHARLLGHSLSIRNPRQLRVEITGSSQAAVQGQFTVTCSRRGVPKSESHTISGTSPADLVLDLKRRSDSCRIATASASFVDPFISGWIEIRAWGTPR